MIENGTILDLNFNTDLEQIRDHLRTAEARPTWRGHVLYAGGSPREARLDEFARKLLDIEEAKTRDGTLTLSDRRLGIGQE